MGGTRLFVIVGLNVCWVWRISACVGVSVQGGFSTTEFFPEIEAREVEGSIFCGWAYAFVELGNFRDLLDHVLPGSGGIFLFGSCTCTGWDTFYSPRLRPLFSWAYMRHVRSPSARSENICACAPQNPL